MNDEQLSAAEHDDLRSRLVAGTKRIKPVGAHRRAIITTTVAVVLVAGLSAGAVGAANFLRSSDQSEPVATPTPTPTPTSTPAPTPSRTPTLAPTTPAAERIAAGPTSRFSFGCNDIAQDVSVFFEGAVPPVASEMPDLVGQASWLSGPAEYAFAQAGALYCEYGASPAAGTGWATVIIVPDAAGALEDREATLGSSDICDAAFPCELVGGAYLEVDGQPAGAVDDLEARSNSGETAVAAVRERLLGEEILEPTWLPPTGSTPVVGDCEAVLPSTAVASAFRAVAAETTNPEGGWGIRAWMISDAWGAAPCYYSESGSDPMNGPSFGVVTWLPGGEWAYRRAAVGAPLDLPGASSEDRALVSCESSDYFSCTVDVLADGNWVRYSLPIDAPEGERAAIVQEVASAIVATVRG
ncbi:hypothetical protein ACFXP7_00550 [Microbacterium sp. P06]|uniref:hypothetical protein n=1 Tax=Microbacterium sp. P06 TaxID=3366949 RepID=UPI003745C22D